MPIGEIANKSQDGWWSVPTTIRASFNLKLFGGITLALVFEML